MPRALASPDAQLASLNCSKAGLVAVKLDSWM